MPPKKTGKDFQWTDDEAELLLSVTHDYKVKKVAEGIDWESVKSKYSDILELMGNELPSSAEEGSTLLKDYPHTKEKVTKLILTTKLKAVRLKFRQAVDSGRRSGHGRVVMLYYEHCERIWGGSPATEQINAGLESTDIGIAQSIVSNDDLEEEDVNEGEGGRAPIPAAVHESNEPSQEAAAESTVHHRRELLNKTLKNFRHEKMKRKLPIDMQLLECANR